MEQALDENNMNRSCVVRVEVGDDGDNMVNKPGIYMGNCRNGFADVSVYGQTIRVSLGNIFFD